MSHDANIHTDTDTPAGARPRSAPRVSIGFPVYNGAAYLRLALDSWLAQTFRDFELVISDNASTDATEAICRDYAARDPRIRYHRNDSNVGAAANFNQAFRMTSGEYFKWAAHDDIYEPTFLARCVAVLDGAPDGVVLCTPLTHVIDYHGEVVESRGYASRRRVPDAGGDDVRELRFDDVLRLRSEHITEVIWGLMRRDALARTRLFIPFHSGDLLLAAELSLLGTFYQIPGHLIRVRAHAEDRPVRSRSEENRWWGLQRESLLKLPLPVKIFLEHLKVIRLATQLSPSQKLARHLQMRAYLGSRLRKRLKTLRWRSRAALSGAVCRSARFTSLPLRAWAFLQFLRLTDARRDGTAGRLRRALRAALTTPAAALGEAVAVPRRQRRQVMRLLLDPITTNKTTTA